MLCLNFGSYGPPGLIPIPEMVTTPSEDCMMRWRHVHIMCRYYRKQDSPPLTVVCKDVALISLLLL